MLHRFALDGSDYDLWLSPAIGGYRLRIENGWEGVVAMSDDGIGRGRLTMEGSSEPVAFAIDGDTIHLHLQGRTRSLRYLDPLLAFATAGGEGAQNVARAPMPGVVVSVKVAPGDRIAAGTVLLIIESMKLETQVRAAHDGTVERLHVSDGDSFDRDAVLVTLS